MDEDAGAEFLARRGEYRLAIRIALRDEEMRWKNLLCVTTIQLGQNLTLLLCSDRTHNTALWPHDCIGSWSQGGAGESLPR